MKFIRGAAFAVAVFTIEIASAQSIDWSNPDSVVRAAIDTSPSLAALRSEVQAARERVTVAGSLPNPMLIGGLENERIDFGRDDMTMYRLGAEQTFVRTARRDSMRRAAELEVQRLERELDVQRAEVEREVRIAYTEAAAAQNRINATEEVGKVATTVTEAARIQYETGSAPQADMIRSRVDESGILHDVIALRRVRSAAVARILALLDLPITSELPRFSLRHEMQHHQERALETSAADTPAIQALQTEVARAEEEIRLAKLSARPDFSVEASYGARPQERDMFTVMGRIELPLRKKTLIDPRIREAIARRDAATQQIELMRRQLRGDIAAAVATRNEAIEQIDLHVDRLVPEARMAFESALASYRTGRTSFESVLGALQSYRALSVDYYEFLQQQIEAEIEIDALRHGARGGAVPSAQKGRM